MVFKIPVTTGVQQISKVEVLALMSCTLDGTGGLSVSRNHMSLKHV